MIPPMAEETCQKRSSKGGDPGLGLTNHLQMPTLQSSFQHLWLHRFHHFGSHFSVLVRIWTDCIIGFVAGSTHDPLLEEMVCVWVCLCECVCVSFQKTWGCSAEI